jgi:phosphoribosylamine---glycine ligase
MDKMNVLIIGSGAREHALGWKISQSLKLDKLFFGPGNPGTLALGTNLSLRTDDFETIKKEVLDHEIELVIVGPEVPLAEGIRDFFEADDQLGHVRMVGPRKAGARLESSKDFAKSFLFRHKIPTAAYSSVTPDTIDQGYRFLESLKPPFVLKADGLAAGKGVIILDSLSEAKQCLKDMLDGKFGKASTIVVIEEFLKGTELSVFILTDGKDWILLPEAKDYKRIGENDTGLNTGGMGAVSPVPFANEAFMQKVRSRIIRPTIQGIQQEQLDYNGFIFFGLINCGGDPFVIEYNVRLGDPETEAIMLRVKGDFLEILNAAASGMLKDMKIETDTGAAATIMLVSSGYPGDFEKGKVISGTDKTEHCLIFHAGTRMEHENLKTSGGRVLAISAKGADRKEALKVCYENAEIIEFEGKYFRSDIGFDL